MSRPSKRLPSPTATNVNFSEEDDSIRVYLHKRQKIVPPPYISNSDFTQSNEPIDDDIQTISTAFQPAFGMFKSQKNSQATLDNYFTNKAQQNRPSDETQKSKATTNNYFSSRPQRSRRSDDAQRTPVKKDDVSPRKAAMLKDVCPGFGEDILATIVDTSDIKLTDILGNQDAKQALEESVIFPALNPSLFSGLRQPCKGILLFGPPGNGKTMLAKAVASESQCTFFNISAATIMSKWVGEGERLMKTLFQVARNAQPSIIFIDEVDSLLTERTEGENGATRRVKTEFLLQFDGCTTKSEDRVLVLAATNRPQELDDGVLRRFPRRIYIDLPDENTRADVIKHNFQHTNTNMNVSTNELMEIARICEHYSFSDLSALCREAAMFPIKGLNRQQLQTAKVDDIRPVNHDDLLSATKLVRASSNLENIEKLKEYAKQFA